MKSKSYREPSKRLDDTNTDLMLLVSYLNCPIGFVCDS